MCALRRTEDPAGNLMPVCPWPWRLGRGRWKVLTHNALGVSRVPNQPKARRSQEPLRDTVLQQTLAFNGTRNGIARNGEELRHAGDSFSW